MKKTLSTLLALGSLAVLGACASSTPYGPTAEGNGYGFSEQQIESNRYRVTFRGNSLTSREQVENYLLYRAAELTLMNGYDYFTMVKDDTEKSTSYRSIGGPDYAYYGRGRPFPYYGYGFGWGPSDFDVRETTRYSAIAYILLGKGTKPNDPASYNAAEVQQNLRPTVVLQPR
ncbi:CC0125/CC1285 family lipoprotein [Aquisalinus flavus]|uniref:Lipoprotein n=1 Tax=Aquisalinus flavus TaxID=1526572 RepID=A0A8J2V208_9PROT|nr:hypothetical protein [Aquisalinus flavus]MBD0425653.1 hypothetical protein [Aquisalinus flavus]UNE48732.1 hypothetical protein FF099_12055 [Aquisalinus flavus]GGD14330.1 hypothetical protein GCM10011342_23890 [Aquisalinus flavus]